MADENRPDPDQLLARVQAEVEPPYSGKLKIFLGFAPGVGKTFAMLEAARHQVYQGVDMVVGIVETHRRADTEELLLGMEILPRLKLLYRGMTLEEFDLDAALARKPQLVLVDELAHTNVPGSRHQKRWQDVQELLEAGIHVYTTLNIQHLESFNDLVAQITGVRVRETLPDSVLDQADDVELVDLPPDELLERLSQGKVYVPDQAGRAMQNFFRKGNLIALRELALRHVAERVDAAMEKYRQLHAISQTWPTAERLLVCVGPSPFSAQLIRAARRMATSLKSPWLAVHVETPATLRLRTEDRERLARNLALAERLGAETATLAGTRVADAVLAFARTRNVSKIVVGKPSQPWWRDWMFGSLVYDLARKSGGIDLFVIGGEGEPTPPTAAAAPKPQSFAPYLWAALVVAACSVGGGVLFSGQIEQTNVVMIYLLGVVGVALRLGRGPAVLASVLSVLTFDFCFVPPIGTFAVSDAQYVITFAVMLVTALVISNLTSLTRLQAESATQRERRSAALFSLSRELAAASIRPEVVRLGSGHISEVFSCQVVVALPDAHGDLVPQGSSPGFPWDAAEQGVAVWVFKHRQRAGLGTATLPGARALHLPLAGSQGPIGVLAVRPLAPETFTDPEQVRLLETFASQTASALERVSLVEETQSVRLQVESERLRNALLSSISHDLRTPLTAIRGASSTLLDDSAAADPGTRRDLAESICEEADRLNRLVGNLLDMTRLEAGAVTPQKEWQPIDEVVGVVLNRLSRVLAEHPVTVRLPADLPLVPIDVMLIQQVLSNLLENAARHTPPGTAVELTAEVGEGLVTVAVADRGPGLAEEDLGRIFEKFYRTGRTRATGGAGLGLAISRAIVETHGGRIWAENQADGGVRFAFTLPLTGAPPTLKLEEAEATPEPAAGER